MAVQRGVYLYDAANFFSDAECETIAGVRVKKKDGKYAVLSQAAQAVFTDSNQYMQFSDNTTHLEVLPDGVKLKLMARRQVVEICRELVIYWPSLVSGPSKGEQMPSAKWKHQKLTLLMKSRRYRGKAENFNPDKARKGKAKPPPSKTASERKAGPSSAEVTPSHQDLPQKPTLSGMIGEMVDAGGKTTELEIPPLPVAQAGGHGGYHAAAEDTHNLFEEVPCLGVAADAVMALQVQNQQANYRIGVPAGAMLTNNLAGSAPLIAPPRDEIKRRLAGQGIMANAFPEFSVNTRLNVKYMRQISDIIGSFITFRNEKLVIDNMTNDGGDSQVIQTHPIDQDQRCDAWNEDCRRTKIREHGSSSRHRSSGGFRLPDVQGTRSRSRRHSSKSILELCELKSTNASPMGTQDALCRMV
ncbi:hypothetical protein GE061_018594 [Apolygus lucorum]|uniref:Nonstructural protein WIV domain-containing protein n=1 Tax=Apolygus lucorum TaxID=248454 RepID=A0A8S9XEG9_APOLU|nr:hypothetical protein GE061_018594 [Apolygus lucorum]